MDLSWEGIGASFRRLDEMIANDFHPEAVVGVAKGGGIPAVFLATALRVDFSDQAFIKKKRGGGA
jgi:hypoxanthine phosphoribosyltransferase